MVLISSVLVWVIQLISDRIGFAVLEGLFDLCHQNLTCGIDPHFLSNEHLFDAVAQLYHEKPTILCPVKNRYPGFPLASTGENPEKCYILLETIPSYKELKKQSLLSSVYNSHSEIQSYSPSKINICYYYSSTLSFI